MRAALPAEVPLIGFAGAPWTVATYMIAGRGTPDQAPARALLYRDPATFDALMERITEATIGYLLAQVAAGAEVVKLFDSWAGSLPGPLFARYCHRARARASPRRCARRIPDVPVIGFPRGAGAGYARFAAEAGVQAVALDTAVDPAWARRALQPTASACRATSTRCSSSSAARALEAATRRDRRGLRRRPHVFNLGHGITPDADPAHVEALLQHDPRLTPLSGSACARTGSGPRRRRGSARSRAAPAGRAAGRTRPSRRPTISTMPSPDQMA